MTPSGTCRECGTALPLSSPGGFCPKCMLGLALGDSSKDENEPGAPDAEPKMSEGKAKVDETGDDSTKLDVTDGFGDEIAGYRLLQEIGQGGCGVVYMAEQEKPVHRRVALKVIKLGMDTKQVVARFEAERQAVARMDHPNIAKVLDAGATEKGRPYFAMELVGGLKITDYCDVNQITTTERLQLFVQVCRAIQHAHQKGIIHRDIKPSNVLVAQHDGVAVPKVIDFGIAKATQGKLIDQTLFTAFEQFIGTPVYMSPEQAELGGLDVDTRSDIYSLGVLLYELLTGKTPFQMDSSKAAGVEAIRRTVVEKEPIKPSTRLSTMREEQLTNVARARQIDPPKLLKLVRGDLDWIVMKCLEKDRGRRYETANGLANDVQRYLNQELVLARPPSAVYRIQKFIRRNRVATLSAAAISLSLILGTIVSTWEAIKATRAQKEQSRLRQEAQAAKQDASEKFWALYTAEARARRWSRESGASFESLAAITKAAAIRPSLQLRNEAIAALVQADIRLVDSKPLGPSVLGSMPDTAGSHYAVCEKAGRVTIRRLADDAEVSQLPMTNAAAVGIWTFSPNGTLLLVYYADHTMRAWDWEQSRCVLEVPRALTGDFSRDNGRLAVYVEGRVDVFDLARGNKSRATLAKSIKVEGEPWACRLNPSGTLLALSHETQTNLWVLDVDSGKRILNFAPKEGTYRTAWSYDGRYLVSTETADNKVHIFDITNGKEFRCLPGSQCICAVFNPEGTMLATSGWDGRTRLWDFLRGGQLVNIYHSGSIVDFTADGRKLMENDWDGHAMHFLEIAAPRGLNTLYMHDPDSRPPSGTVKFSRDGKLVAFQTVDGPELWDVESNVEIGSYRNDQAGLIGFDSGDKTLIMADSEGLILWPVASLRNLTRTDSRPEPNHLPANLPSPKRMPQRIIGSGGIISADGEHLFLAGSNHCQILDTRTFANSIFTEIHGGVRYTAANHDGSLIATGAWLSPGVKVWDGKTGKLVKLLPMPDTTSVIFSPDGRLLVTGTFDKYEIWEVGSWTQVLTIPQEKGNDFVPMMAFSPDGRILAGTHSRRIVRLHDAATGEVLADLEPPEPHTVTSLCFNNDGSRLAVCEGFQATRIWDLDVIRSHLATMGLDWEVAAKSH